MRKDLTVLVLATIQLVERHCPVQTPTEITESLRSSHFTWWLLHRRRESQGISNFMGSFMRLTPQQSIFVCLYSSGLILGAPYPALKSTRRLTLSLRYLCSTESPMQMSVISSPWSGLRMSRWPATYLTEATLTLQGSFTYTNVEPSLSIREKGEPDYEIVAGEAMLDGTDGILRDHTIRFTGRRNKDNYTSELRSIVYYAEDLHRTFTYYTNNFYLRAKDIALLYRYRWQVELFFKWIKQHLRVKSFWGTSENSVRIQIHVAIITYCLIAIIEHYLKLNRPVFQVMRILGSSLLVKDNIKELFEPLNRKYETTGDGQLSFDFDFDKYILRDTSEIDCLFRINIKAYAYECNLLIHWTRNEIKHRGNNFP